jgi:hypothetical protein
MIFRVLKKSSKFYVLLSGPLCILFLSLLFIAPASAADLGPIYDNAPSAPIEIRDCIPQVDAGIINFARVPPDTSFAVLIRSVHGLDLNSANAIRFIIDDDVQQTYIRNLNSDTVRVVILENGPDGRPGFLWAVYDRFLETYMPAGYALNSYIHIEVQIQDVEANILQPAAFEFKIESATEQAASHQNLPETEEIYLSDEPLNNGHDAGIQVVSGELAGARVMYNSSEPLTPEFESSDAIEEVDLAGLETVSRPLNLSPHTVFDTPVTVLVPVPEGVDIRSVGLAYYDGTQWLPAVDPDGNVLAGGEGWMVPGSRVDYPALSPALIEVQVYHFSGTQTVFFASFDSTREEDRHSTASGSNASVYVSCFVDSMSFDPEIWLWVILVAGVLMIISAPLRSRNICI